MYTRNLHVKSSTVLSFHVVMILMTTWSSTC